jgi:hypothetical protein
MLEDLSKLFQIPEDLYSTPIVIEYFKVYAELYEIQDSVERQKMAIAKSLLKTTEAGQDAMQSAFFLGLLVSEEDRFQQASFRVSLEQFISSLD